MEESESNDAVSGSLYRAGAMRSSARLLSAFVLGLGTIASTFLFSDHENRGNHHLRITNDFQRSLERTLQGDMPICELDCCMQYESDICPSDNEWITAIPFAVQIMLIIILICMSALFSGLTLGLMSLDVTGLEIVMSGDDEQAAGYAKAIFPVRKDGNLLLCTLLLGNVAVNALLSILLAEYAGGIVGFITSTFLIVIFGEIVPQALVSSFVQKPSMTWKKKKKHASFIPFVTIVLAVCASNRKFYCANRQSDSFHSISCSGTAGKDS